MALDPVNGHWTQQQKLLAPDGQADDVFGVRAWLSEDQALVSAFFDDDNGAQSGSAHMYRFDGTTSQHEQKFLAPDGEADY